MLAVGATAAGLGAFDRIRSYKLARRRAGASPGRVRKSILINRPVHEVYRFWRDFENLPRVMSQLKTVRTIDERRSHWTVEARGRDRHIDWDVELTDDRPEQRIAWRARSGPALHSSGAVEFAPLPGRGTRVSLELTYAAPRPKGGGPIAALTAALPERQTLNDLRRLKQWLETGEIARSDSPHGPRSLVSAHLP